MKQQVQEVVARRLESVEHVVPSKRHNGQGAIGLVALFLKQKNRALCKTCNRGEIK